MDELLHGKGYINVTIVDINYTKFKITVLEFTKTTRESQRKLIIIS